MQYQEAAGGSAAAGVGFPGVGKPEFKESSVTGALRATSFADYKIIRRNGAVVAFEPSKIAVAMTKAFIAVRGGQGAASAAIREQVEKLTESVVQALLRRQPAGGTFHIEDVQDQVELSLMRDGAHDVARSYVLYRERRSQERAREGALRTEAAPQLMMLEHGQRVPLDLPRIESVVRCACEGLSDYVTPDAILGETVKNLYDGVPLEEVWKSAILASRALIENDPAYSYVTARLLLHTVRNEVLGEEVTQAQMAARYAESFPRFIKYGIEAGLLDDRLAQYDLKRLGSALKAERDLQFDYLGLQTLYDRYFLHHDG
ncbi:MAG: ATP cone domain-containing protein, partial [Burkholderiaceae bacterium]